ncbi:glutamate-5-semialdehyde dehydrogenase [bacterium]|nr:MAG: glutamate-5-semialdehyde dehydrogenase [bacterium]
MEMKNINELAKRAKDASYALAAVPSRVKDGALRRMARALESNCQEIIRENKKDMAYARHLSGALTDRLILNEARVRLMADSLRHVALLKDPVGEVIKSGLRPNGLRIQKSRVPIGVIGIIYEARPNVTSDCIGLCLKSGNAVILKGGSEAINTNRAIFRILQKAAKKSSLPPDTFSFIDTTGRKALDYLLGLNKYIDLIIPRGGEGLIRFVDEHSKIPVIKHYKGICHTYVDARADLAMAENICFNAKAQRPGVCNAMETLLVHIDIAREFLPAMINRYKQAGVEIRGCPRTRKIVLGIKAAKEIDWHTEYLGLILSVKVVSGLMEAISHINHYGSRHSDAIVTKDRQNAMKFLRGVDSACVYVNASTRFTDGYEFGLGAEIGISTDKIHARGPMALEELTTYKYMIFGNGQVRT